jgi:hypothetical protein
MIKGFKQYIKESSFTNRENRQNGVFVPITQLYFFSISVKNPVFPVCPVFFGGTEW